MRNPEVTKSKILTAAARLFNVQGYKSTSISDITSATGLTKGAIYRHFHDKEDLEEETFIHLSEIVRSRFGEVIRSKNNAPDKLRAICNFFHNYIDSPMIEGGCPVLNAAVESDDTKPGLKKEVIKLMDSLQEALQSILTKGIKYGQIKPDTDVAYYASVFIATLEGGIMMSKLRGNQKDMQWVIKHLHGIVDTIKS